MSFIENAKTYTGRDLETIFFRPMLSGQKRVPTPPAMMIQ